MGNSLNIHDARFMLKLANGLLDVVDGELDKLGVHSATSKAIDLRVMIEAYENGVYKDDSCEIVDILLAELRRKTAKMHVTDK